MDAIETPIFLVGSLRSGSTLLRLMLDHHPDIAFCSDSEFLVTHISEAGEFPEISAYRAALAADRVFRHGRYEVDPDLNFQNLVKDFLHQKLQRDEKSIVGATVHYQFAKLKHIWPNAKYIYLYRDGRDVANSVVKMGWAGNSYVGADWWLNAEREWNFVRSRIPADSWIEVQFEKLTSDTGMELQRICDFIGVPYSNRMFEYVLNSSYSLPDVSANYKWRRSMQLKDLRMIEAKLASSLRNRGYEPSGQPPLQVGALGERLIYSHSRLFAVKDRIARFGPWLVLQELISRRLGILGWNRRLARSIDDIVDRNLH